MSRQSSWVRLPHPLVLVALILTATSGLIAVDQARQAEVARGHSREFAAQPPPRDIPAFQYTNVTPPPTQPVAAPADPAYRAPEPLTRRPLPSVAAVPLPATTPAPTRPADPLPTRVAPAAVLAPAAPLNAAAPAPVAVPPFPVAQSTSQPGTRPTPRVEANRQQLKAQVASEPTPVAATPAEGVAGVRAARPAPQVIAAATVLTPPPVAPVVTTPAVAAPALTAAPVARPADQTMIAVRPQYEFNAGTGGVVANSSVASLFGADTWYNAGFSGTNARIANIEGGHPWRGHEVFNSWLSPTNYFAGGGALTGDAALDNHPTSVSHVMVGGGATSRQRGVAFGIATGGGQFYAGNVATVLNANGTFNVTTSTVANTYADAMFRGVNGDPTKVANVINSSWGGGGTGGEDFVSRSMDALLVIANQGSGGFTRNGVASVVAAGNGGPGANTVTNPASGINAFVVGSSGGLVGELNGQPNYTAASVFSGRSPSNLFVPTNAAGTSGSTLTGVRARVDLLAPGEHLVLANFGGPGSSPTAYSPTQGTSFAAPGVAGGVGLMSDYVRSTPGVFATAADIASALDGRVTKAALMNSANKSANWNNGQAFTGDRFVTTRALDFTTGAGFMNLDQAFLQYADPSASKILAAGAVNNVNRTGWARGTLNRVGSAEASQTFLLGNLAAYSEINSTLVWFANRGINLGTLATTEIAFHDLKLEVWRTDAAGNLLSLVGESNARHLATEHLSFLTNEEGNYAVRVVRPEGAAGTLWSFAGDDDATTYGLAWLNRESAVATTGTITNPTAVNRPNLVIAPVVGQTAAATFNTGTTTFTNSAYVGGSDRGNGGTGTLTVADGATLVVSNKVQVSPNSSVVLNNAGRLEAGAINLATAASLTATGTGTSRLLFSEMNLAGGSAVTAGAGATLETVSLFDGFSFAKVTRVNLTGGLARLGGDGNVTIDAPFSGVGGIEKVGSGTLTLRNSDSANRFYGTNSYTGGTTVSAGTLVLGRNGRLPGGNLTIANGATLNMGVRNSNDPDNQTAAGAFTQLNLNGTLRVTGGNGDLFVGELRSTGGQLNLAGTNNFWVHFTGTGAGLTTLGGATTSVFTGGTTATRLQNDTGAALPITVAAGTTPNGLDLDLNVTLSNGGTNPIFVKRGLGTARLGGTTANTANLVVEAGQLRVDSTDLNQLGSGTLTLAGGTLAYGGTAAGVTNKAFNLTANSQVSVLNAGQTLTLGGAINYGSSSLFKGGPGTLVISGNTGGSASAQTVVNQGTLRLTGVLPAGSSVVVNSGGVMDYRATGPGALTVNAGGTVIGSNNVNINGPVTLSGTISPGTVLGERATLVMTSGNFLAGSRYTWDIASATGTPGSAWDFLSGSGTLNIDGLTIDAFSTGITNFDNTQTYTFTIATFAGGVTGTNITVNTAGIGNTNFGDGAFFAQISGNNLNLVFAPVPEPTTVLAAGTLGLLAIRTARRQFTRS